MLYTSYSVGALDSRFRLAFICFELGLRRFFTLVEIVLVLIGYRLCRLAHDMRMNLLGHVRSDLRFGSLTACV